MLLPYTILGENFVLRHVDFKLGIRWSFCLLISVSSLIIIIILGIVSLSLSFSGIFRYQKMCQTRSTPHFRNIPGLTLRTTWKGNGHLFFHLLITGKFHTAFINSTQYWCFSSLSSQTEHSSDFQVASGASSDDARWSPNATAAVTKIRMAYAPGENIC